MFFCLSQLQRVVSYHDPLVSMKQLLDSPLTSLIYKEFLPAQLLFSGCFCFAYHSVETVCENLRSAVSEIVNNPSWHQQLCHGQSHLDHTVPLQFQVKSSQVSLIDI